MICHEVIHTQIFISLYFIHFKSFSELQKRLELTKRQLQDSELQLKEADANNFNSSMKSSYLLMFHLMLFVSFKHKVTLHLSLSLLVMEIADLRAQLKKAQKQASKVHNINGLSICYFPAIVCLLSSNTLFLTTC